jgi:uncharacterized membrane protein
MMGKAADNERLKISATMFNNISVAMFVTAFVVPFFVFLTKTEKEGKEFIAAFTLTDFCSVGAGIFIVLMGGVGFHFLARGILAKIQD